MYVSVTNIQDPGALALISWSRKSALLQRRFFYCLCHVQFFCCFKKVSALLFSLLINATHLITFILFASQLCTRDRWLTIPSVYFSVWVSAWIYRQMASCCLRFTDLVNEYLRIFQWVGPIVNLILEFGNTYFFMMQFLWILIPLLSKAKVVLRTVRLL